MFSVTADAAGKLAIETLRWTGPETAKSCILGDASKVTVTPLPGPAVGSTWEWSPPPPEKAPANRDAEQFRDQGAVAADAVEGGGRVVRAAEPAAGVAGRHLRHVPRRLDGKAHGPTVLSSTAKDGSFDSCVQDVITKMQFPASEVQVPYPVTLRFHVGRLEKL